MKVRSLLFLIFVMGFGYFTTILYTERTPAVACTGQVQIDTASYELVDLRSNGLFIENQSERIYLSINDNKTTNDVLEQHLKLSGRLKPVIVDSGALFLELVVTKVEPVDANLQTKEPFCTSLEKKFIDLTGEIKGYM